MIGFYKIVKKYDKTLNEATLEAFMGTMNRQPFCTSNELSQMLEVITSYVSRDKLIEWERFASERTQKSDDEIFPAVRVAGIVISILVFLITSQAPLLTTADASAKKCLSLLMFAMSMWVTEAIPYFATAMLIPPLVVFMGVLKDGNGKLMNTEASALFVLSHMFNHTSVSQYLV